MIVEPPTRETLAFPQSAQGDVRLERSALRRESDGLTAPLDPILQQLEPGRRLDTDPENAGPAPAWKRTECPELQRQGVGTVSRKAQGLGDHIQTLGSDL